MKHEIKGYKLNQDESNFNRLVYDKVDEYPSSWNEYYVGKVEKSNFSDWYGLLTHNKNTHKYEALRQLELLRDEYRRIDGVEIDFSNEEEKYCIFFENDKIVFDEFIRSNTFLSFAKESTRDLFLDNFRDLIEEAKPFLG